jgi:hypothetical protein
MNSRTKNSLIIIGTLLIGIIIGTLISGRYTKIRMDSIRSGYSDQGVFDNMMRVIDPSPQQMRDIEPAFDRYLERRRDRFNRHYDDQILNMQEFENEIRPCLNNGQIERLRMMKNRKQERFQNYNNKWNRQGRGQGRNREGRRSGGGGRRFN